MKRHHWILCLAATMLPVGPTWAQAAKPKPPARVSTNSEAAKLLAQADALANKGKYEEAAALMQKAAELTPEDWALWDAVGWTHLDNAKLDLASKAFASAQKAAPAGSSLLGGPLVVAFAQNKKDEVAKLLAQLVPSNKLAAARAILEKGMAAKQFSTEWNYALGHLYADVLRNSGRALGLLEAVTKADPKHAAAWLLLVDVNRDLERTPQEDAAAVKYLALAPDAPDAFRLRAERATSLRQYPTAISEYKAGIAKAPHSDNLYYQLARVHERIGAKAEAEAVYRQLIQYAESNKLDDVRLQARSALGAFHFRHLNYVEAEKYYADAAKRPDATVSTWETWGCALAMLSKWEEAATAMQGAADREAKARGTTTPEARDSVLAARYRAAVYQVAAGKRDDAAKLLDTALAAKSDVRSATEMEAAAFQWWLTLKEPTKTRMAYAKSDERWAAFLWREVRVDLASGEREVRGRFNPTATAWRAVLQQVNKANPDCWPAKYALARIYASAGYNTEALELLSTAARRRGEWWALHFAMGQYYASQRDKDNGVDILRHTLRLAPECRQARVYLSLLTNIKEDDEDDLPPKK